MAAQSIQQPQNSGSGLHSKELVKDEAAGSSLALDTGDHGIILERMILRLSSQHWLPF